MIGFAIDMDGTVYRGERPIPGAAGFVDGLRERGIPFRFLTNNSAHTRRFYSDRLRRIGIDATEDDVLTSTLATVRFIEGERGPAGASTSSPPRRWRRRSAPRGSRPRERGGRTSCCSPSTPR